MSKKEKKILKKLKIKVVILIFLIIYNFLVFL